MNAFHRTIFDLQPSQYPSRLRTPCLSTRQFKTASTREVTNTRAASSSLIEITNMMRPCSRIYYSNVS